MIVWASLLLVGYVVGRIVTDTDPGWDRSLVADLHGKSHAAVTDVMRVITDIGSTPVLTAAFILALVILLVRRDRRSALFLLLASPGTVLLVQILKRTVNRPRPPGQHLVTAQGTSWPSGHASSSLALYGALLLIVFYLPARAGERGRLARVVVTVLTATLIALIGFSRVYLGVHYPTDVIASWFLAGTWLAFLTHVFGKSERRDASGRSAQS